MVLDIEVFGRKGFRSSTLLVHAERPVYGMSVRFTGRGVEPRYLARV